VAVHRRPRPATHRRPDGHRHLSGGSFYLDPFGWVLRDDVPVTNPNVICFGKPGRGKSATTKAFMPADDGLRLPHPDPRRPQGRVRTPLPALGVEPFRIGPGLPARINPPLAAGWDTLDRHGAHTRAGIVFGRWLTLIRGLVGSQRIGATPVPFGPVEEQVVKAALRDLTGYTTGATHLVETTIPALWHQLTTPTPQLIEAVPVRQHPAVPRRDPAAARRPRPARRRGPGRTVRHPHHHRRRLGRPHRLAVPVPADAAGGRGRRHRPDLPVLLGARDARERRTGDLRINVRDEVWKQMRLGVEAVKSFDQDLRLSRAAGDIQWANAHKPADLLSVGDAGSQAVTIAKDLLHLTDVKILHGQDHGVAADLEDLLGLGPIARDVVTRWAMQGKGRALWCVGDQQYKVQTVLHPLEAALTFTNDAITGAA
jgi:hypothetical protein